MSEAKFMLDRVAEAIARVAVVQTTPDFHALAVAAVKAMREPTEVMKEAGSEFVYEAWGDGPTIAREAWQANIDAILKPLPVRA